MGLFGLVAASATPAWAGDVPLYQPAPAWIVSAPLPDAAALTGDGPAMVIFDQQQRIEDGRLWSYVDGATRIASPEMLAQFATLSVPWAPDKGDLIVHELAILRGGERIDLLAQGQKFTVLRREQALEQRELTGILTATLAIEGLRVGDVLRFRVTNTAKDEALAGRVQSVGAMIAAPVQVGFARMRYSWPADHPPHWKILAEGVAATPKRNGAYTELSLALPAPKQPEMPGDAPQRFQHPPLIELSTFADWADVSKVMAPLYGTEGAIAAGGPLAAEVAAIKAAEAAPLGRAQRALELVQDKVRYLAVGMDGGNYIPQKAARTWEVRYGDCKAKTLLLLAMLHAMDIEAEPVLAHIGLGDFVPDRLPSAQAFNHVLVRATIGGESLYLDGTGSGSRLADIRDTPPFRHVLPVRTAGAGLVEIATHANARPSLDLAIDADESASTDLPSVFDATAVLRGGHAQMMTLAGAQLGEKEKRELVTAFFQGFTGEAQFSSASITPDPAAGSVTLKAHGVVTTPWFSDERQRKRNLSRTMDMLSFTPDRARSAWRAVPVATPDPSGVQFRLRVRLPDGGRDYVLEGEPDLEARLAGYQLARRTRLDGGIVTVEERIDSTGAEIPAAQVAAERDRVATAQARQPRLIEPEAGRRRWEVDGRDPAGATQVKAIEETFAKAIADNVEEVSGYASRASFRTGIGDRKGARADLTRALAIEPSVELYLQRSALAYELGDLSSAAADAEAARQLDPSSADAIGRLAFLKAEAGDLAAGIAMLDERIALGGDTRVQFREAKANLIGEFGDPAEGLKLYDTLIAEKPGSPSLLNGRCWLKGTRSVMLDTALKDCTAAIELSSNTTSVLDSRALVWYRLGRDEEALRDLDAALAASPALAASRYLRGVVLNRLKREAQGKRDLAVARRLEPSVDRIYARYGVKP
jgi:transglutaminase-like putative cysteine protease/tetratricopeptide (TPR) repeat protein